MVSSDGPIHGGCQRREPSQQNTRTKKTKVNLSICSGHRFGSYFAHVEPKVFPMVCTYSKIIKINKKTFVSISFPWKRTLTLTLGMGWGVGWGDHLGIPKSQKSTKQFVRQLFALLRHFLKIMKNIFTISSYIQKTTPDPMHALKITIYNTQHTNNTNIHLQTNPTFSKVSKIYFFKKKKEEEEEAERSK